MNKIRVYADGSVTRPGVHTPKGTKVHNKDSRNKPFNTLTIKVPGYKFWVGLNLPQSYAAAEYIVYQVIDGRDDNGVAVYDVVEVTRFPVKG